MTTRLVPTTRKPQVVWAVVSKDKTDRIIHATGLSKAGAWEEFERLYPLFCSTPESRARFKTTRIRWQEVEPAKKGKRK